VPRAGVGEEIVEQIAPVRPIPQVVMRVDDRQLRLENRLAPAIEPVLAHRKVVVAWGGRRR
jgi:hypothetical protein